MVPISLSALAEVVGGTLEGADVEVTAPAVIDGREAVPGSLFVAFVGEHTDGHEHAPQAGEKGAVAVLGSRPTSLPTVVVDDVQAALQALAAHAVAQLRESATVVALTGSQGKTSTKDLLAAILAEAGPTVATYGSYNNEIGVPVTALRADAETRFLVLEMGARGKGHIADLTRLAPPDVAVVLNVGQAHLGEFGSQEAIAEAKGELVEALHEGGTAVLNADDTRVAAMRSRTQGQVLFFGQGANADVQLLDVALDRLGRPSFTLSTPEGPVAVTLQLVGAHQALNAAAAAAAALAAGATLEHVEKGLNGVQSVSKWRMELSERDGITFLNDAYNANPDSMRAGIDALATLEGERRIAVLGVMLELGDTSDEEHRRIGLYAAERGVDEVVVVGEGARSIADAVPGSTWVSSNEEAVAWLREHLTQGDVVLFKASRGARLDEVAAALA